MSNIKAVLSPSGTHLKKFFFSYPLYVFHIRHKSASDCFIRKIAKKFSLQKYRTRRTYDNYKATLISTPIFQIILKAMYRQKKNYVLRNAFKTSFCPTLKRSSIPSYLKKAAIGNACSCICFVKTFDTWIKGYLKKYEKKFSFY